MVTLEDIAQKTGVSTATVSLALFKRGIDSKTGHRRISVQTENRIRTAAEEMGYVPNIMARGMRKKQTFMIALVVNSIASSFYGSIIEGLTNAIEPKGYHLLICHSNHAHEREYEHLSNLQRRQIDGVVIAPVLKEGESRLREGIENFKGKPVLLLGYNPIHHPFAVTFDDGCGSVDAVNHLLGLGHTGVAFVPASLEQPHRREEVLKWIPVAERFHGYRMAMKNASLSEQMILDFPSLLRGIHEGRITAVVASTDEVAARLYPLLKGAGIRLPDELSIVAVGDTPVATLLEPALTAICQPKVELGLKAGEMMIRAIESKQIARETMPMKLIRRQSCVPFASSLRSNP